MDVLFLQKQYHDCIGSALLIDFYCNTKLFMFDGIHVTYACNHSC